MEKIKHNQTNKSKTILLILFTIFIILSHNVFADETNNILTVIHNNYQAAVDGDVDAYMNTMDTLFLDQTSPDGFSFADYYAGTFNVIEINKYNVNDPKIEFMNESALVFYNLKETIKNKDTNEEKNIDNDVVTFLWNYDGNWKIRWTISQSNYQFKLEAGLLTEIVADMTFSELDNVTLIDEAVDKGIYTKTNIDLKDKDNSASGRKGVFSNKILFFIMLLVILGLFVYAYVKNSKVKKKTNNILKKLFELLKQALIWIKKNGIPLVIKFSKWLWKWIVKICKLIFYHSKKAYQYMKPHVKKAYKKGMKKISDVKEKNKKSKSKKPSV